MHAVAMLLDLMLAALPLLCAAVVVAGIALDARLERDGPRHDASVPVPKSADRGVASPDVRA